MDSAPAGGSGDAQTLLNQRVDQALGPQGPFASQVSGYRDRPAQRELAGAIASTIADNGALVAEAGTGIGKTFAYLVPALLSECRVLISTGTKNLQDQLFSRDLPAVKAALGVGPSTALLKGRSNYVCRHHLQKNLAEGRFERRSDIAVLKRIERFASISRTGDRAEAPGIAEDAPAWSMATSTRDNCLGQECEHIDDCFVFRARRKALQADVVVINHHLFCADMALRDDGVSEILPAAHVLIFDEAHQLPETATNFFGHNVSSRQVIDFTRDCQRTGRADAPDGGDWIELTGQVEQCLRELRLAAGQPGRRDEAALRGTSFRDYYDALDGLITALGQCGEALAVNRERSRDLEMLQVRCQALVQRIRRWIDGSLGREPSDQALGSGAEGDPVSTDVPGDPWADAPTGSQPEASAWDDVEEASGGSTTAADVTPEESAESVFWLDVHRNGLTMHQTPLSVAGPFRRQMASKTQSWIFTSATLSIGSDFSLFVDAMGLEQARTERYESPYDFQNQALLYVPEGIGEPRSQDFARNLLDAVIPLLRANNGRAFFLCTSLRMVDTVAERLRGEFAGDGNIADSSAGASDDAFTILAQGSQPRDMLLSQFREQVRPILVGSASFWEGVDVVGQQLSLVIIDKLPFAPPDDPLLQARSEAMRRRGVQPFTAMHLPRAGMALKQGAGRLIRSEKDRGLLVIGDTRLAEKAYGRRLLRGLPPFARTRSAEQALAFIQQDR